MNAPVQKQPPPASAEGKDEEQPCPGCGHPMPALKGARLSICRVCGYKESCCY
ncbi:MAG TPA: hypothetical protein VK009_21525 [Chloroflexota bacterium]|nr:hypothetical protein [Chloroflexota bacterium]